MKNIILSLFSIIILSQSNTLKAHPIYITISNVSVSGDSVKVVIRLFKNDITDAIINEKQMTGLILSEKDENSNRLIEEYIQNHFKIIFRSRIELTYINSIFDSKSILIFLNAQIKNPSNNLIIENTLLSNMLGNQRNMVIVSYNKNEMGFSFTSTDTIKEFILEQ